MNEMQWLVSKSLKYRYLVVYAAITVMIFGIGRVRNLPVDVFPEFAPPRVEIQTPSLGLTAGEVEELVTVPLEQALRGLPRLDVMRSKSVISLSSIILIFERGTDIMEARQLVQERIALVTPDLPTWASPPMLLPPLSSTARTIKIGISSPDRSIRELSMTTYWKIRQQLLRVRGVANVAIWGEQIQMPIIQVDQDLLAEYNIPVTEVVQVASDALDVGLMQYSTGSVPGSGGILETPNQRFQIHHVTPIIDPADLTNIVINNRVSDEGTPLRLEDVATIEEGTWPMIGDAVVNDGAGLLLIVEKFPWANTVEVSHGVEAAMEAMKPGLPGLEFDTTIFRPATFVEVALENLINSLLIGAGLVVIILLLFLWDWRIALISATIIPVTAIITLLVLSAFDTTLNVMVLAGLIIAIGAVVDDAIVDVENVVRRLRQYRREGIELSTETIVLDASLEVRSAIINASLIEMTTLLPVFFMEGLSGAFFQPLAMSYVVATLVSPIVAMTVTPAMVMILLDRAPVHDRISPVIPWLHRWYDGLLRLTLRKPRLSYVAAGVILVSGIAVWPLLGQELLPEFKERDFLMHWLGKPGTSHPEMLRTSTLACQELRTIPGVRNCGSHIGQALFMDEVYGMYFAEHWVSVDPSVDYNDTLNQIQATVDGYPGLYRDVQTYLKERIREVLTGSSHPILIQLFGQDLDVLREQAAKIEEELSDIEGLRDLHVELLVDIPQIEIEVDLEAAEQFGITPGDVRRAVAYLVAGVEAGDIHIPSRTFDVQVWTEEVNRNSLDDIYNLLIDSPKTGEQVRLVEVADVTIAPVPNGINHENLLRRLNIEADVASGYDLGSVVTEVENTLQGMEFPVGYYPELLGEYEERQAASNRIFAAGIVAAVVIFFLLRVSLGDWRLATMSFLSLPMAIVGGILAAFFFSDAILSLGSLVGFLTILGIAARNGIMLISHYQHLEEFEGEEFGLQLVIRGAIERIAPIMMTALTAGLALVPLVIAGDIPGHEIEHPMAIVILGGLVTSTLVNLFIVPALYLSLGKSNITSVAATA